MNENVFASSLAVGLRLSQRVRYTEDALPPKVVKMERSASAASATSVSTESYLPRSPMVYAMVNDPSIVDNPDRPSYQPYVHGRCDPPALIPLHMYGIEMEVNCFLDTAFVAMSGTWRLHCVKGNKSCDCCLAIVMGEQGSVLGFEIEVSGKAYQSQLIMVEDLQGLTKSDNINFLKPHIFLVKIPKVTGGSKLSIKARWSQKLLYTNGQFCLSLPISFPVYVTPGKFPKRERILLNVNSGTETPITCKSSSHSLKEVRNQVGNMSFLYEAEVYTWSRIDFEFAYALPSSNVFGGVLLQSPQLNDLDQREMFSLYLFPGVDQNMKVFKRRIIFLIDISGSMRETPIENVKQATLASLQKLEPQDSFNIVAFSANTLSFSSSMEPATRESIESANQWMNSLYAEGSTNILLPLNQAMEMLIPKSDAMSFIFLITDGTVENERDICNVVKDRLANGGLQCPRLFTFGIGSHCNHYFLQMLAQIGKGHYDASYDADSIASRFKRLCSSVLSTILADIYLDGLDHLKHLTIYPASIHDLSDGSPLLIYGRYSGEFPESVELGGIRAGNSNFVMNLKVRQAKDISLDRVFAQRQMSLLTSTAWFLDNKGIEEQVANMSVQTGIPSEYTRMVLFQPNEGQKVSNSIIVEKPKYSKAELQQMVKSNTVILLPPLGVGFGDLKKTVENVPPGVVVKEPDATDLLVKATTNCCQRVLDRVCCICCITLLSKMNSQLVTACSQLCAALACCECIECCYDLCT